MTKFLDESPQLESLGPKRKKKFWIDGQCFQSASTVRAIGRYVSELLKVLHARNDVHLIVSLNGNLADEAIAARRYLRHYFEGLDVQIWFGTATDGEAQAGRTPMRQADGKILASHINSLAPDLAICPSPFEGIDDRTAPFTDISGVYARTACIFYDAIPHRSPQHYFHSKEWAESYYRRLLSVRKFDLVLCSSEFAAREYRDILELGNCVSISAGLARDFESALSIPATDCDVPGNLPSDYVLYVGGLDWRNNVPTLVAAMSHLPEVHAGKLALVLACSGGGEDVEALAAQWTSLGLPEDGFVRVGWLSDAQLVECYRRAKLAVQPSLMEGFSFAAFEAMAAGCPFLAAKGGSGEEVLGNEGQLFDGYDSHELAQAITRFMHDADFAREIVRCGLARVKIFNWERVASTMLDAVNNLVVEREIDESSTNTATNLPRIVVDVTSTAQSLMYSGIQRVLRKLSAELILNKFGIAVALSYGDNLSGWYKINSAYPHAISRDPRNRLSHGDNDIYFMLDSSWELSDIHLPRLRDALLLGQNVTHGVHDLGPLTMPAMTIPSMPGVFRRWFEGILGYSTNIICVSRSVADELYDLVVAIKLPRPLGIGYVGLGANFSSELEESSWFNFDDQTPLFLMVGTIEPRKGHSYVLDAFNEYWAAGGTANLLIVGAKGWNTRLLMMRFENHPKFGKLLHVRSNVSDAQLRGAYRNAQALIMASWLEGFGLPVVEAAHLGCPLILSDLPVFREIAAGDHNVEFFPVGDVKALLGCLENCLPREVNVSTACGVEERSWSDTASQVIELLIHDNWYKQYTPETISANVSPTDIGEIRMFTTLDIDDRKYSARYVEGPLLSEDGKDLQFTVAIRNGGGRVWTSVSGINGGLEINVASHLIARSGEVLTLENTRTSIPFILAPGKELFVPIRISTDWLARGACEVDVVMVQELAFRFGEPLRIRLNERPMIFNNPISYNISSCRLQILRAPWLSADLFAWHVLIGIINTSEQVIAMSEEILQSCLVVMRSNGDRVQSDEYQVVSSCAMIPPYDVGLMTVRLGDDIVRFGDLNFSLIA